KYDLPSSSSCSKNTFSTPLSSRNIPDIKPILPTVLAEVITSQTRRKVTPKTTAIPDIFSPMIASNKSEIRDSRLGDTPEIPLPQTFSKSLFKYVAPRLHPARMPNIHKTLCCQKICTALVNTSR